jgi:hypothetical protein
MKYIKKYEQVHSDTGFTLKELKYKIGDYVKFEFNRQMLISEITLIDDEDLFKPYYIEIQNDNKNCTWVSEKNIFSDEETKTYNQIKKYNI